MHSQIISHGEQTVKSLYSLLIAVAVLTLYGCSESTVDPQSGTGTLQVNMVDRPASYDQVNIVVDSVQAHFSNNDSESGWTTLNRTTTTYDLLKLVNGANALIGSAVLPVGKYSQIRLYVGSGSNIVVDGVTQPLITPSGSQSGIKVNVDVTIQQDVTYLLTLDFDANKSIVKSGNPASPTYSLKPVIRAIVTGTTGFIIGVVVPSSALPTVWAFSLVDTLSTTADLTGGFKLAVLPPATYSVYIAPKDTLYRDTTITNVSVTAANTTNLGTITLQHK
jgi:hypothetical protein